MTGKIERVPLKDGRPRDFCFIVGENGTNYFLHISKFREDWKKLVSASMPVQVKFEKEEGPKGPLAINCYFVSGE